MSKWSSTQSKLHLWSWHIILSLAGQNKTIEIAVSDIPMSPAKAFWLSSAYSDGTYQAIYSVLALYNPSNSFQMFSLYAQTQELSA